MSERKEGSNHQKQETFIKKIEKRADNAEAIIDFLKGLKVQECLDTLDAVKRRILSNSVN